MADRYAGAIVTAAGETVWLPQPILTWSDEAVMRNTSAAVLGGDGELLLGQTMDSRRISIAGLVAGWGGDPFYSRAAALTRTSARNQWIRLEAALRGKFKLFRHDDEHYADCVLAHAPRSHARPDMTMEYGLEITATDPAAKRDLSVNPDESPYRHLVFDGGGGEGEIVQQTYNLGVFTVAFSGLAATQGAGEEHQIVMPGPSGARWRITRLAVVACSGAVGTGTTVLRASGTGIGGGGTAMELTLAHTARRASTMTGSFLINAGASLYLWLATGGIHSDIQVAVYYEQA